MRTFFFFRAHLIFYPPRTAAALDGTREKSDVKEPNTIKQRKSNAARFRYKKGGERPGNEVGGQLYT